jgi:hypothetical protein
LHAIDYAGVGAALVVADGDDEVAAHKQMRFTEFDPRVPELGGSHGDKQVPLVFLELGPLVGGDRVLQRQRVQAELVAQAGDSVAFGRFELDPDETVRLADVIADVVERNRLGFGVMEEQAVDDGLRQR